MLLDQSLKHIIEGLIFMATEPVTAADLAEISGQDTELVENICKKLMEEYEEDRKGFCLRRIDGGYLFYASPLLSPYLEKIYGPRMRNLSPAAYETLAIVAYQGPVTRSHLELIRGVRSDGPLNQLLTRGLVEEVGRKDSPGRPILYNTGPYFMQAFGLDRIEDLEHYDKVQGILEEHALPVDDPEVDPSLEDEA